MVRLGFVGLDTSHLIAFAKQLDERSNVDIAAVWNGGDVRDLGT